MDEILSMGNQVLNSGIDVDGVETSIGVLAVALLLSVIICFFGLKLVKLLAALAGFAVGLTIGIRVAALAGVEGVLFAVIMIACGLILGALAFILYRFGVFCAVFLYSITTMLPLTNSIESATVRLIVILTAAIILAVLAVVFVEPMIIVITAVFGGLAVGNLIVQVIGTSSPSWLGLAIGAVAAIAGLIVQFIMHSRKVGKKEKKHAETVKEEASMESEVEKARTVLTEEELDEEPEEEPTVIIETEPEVEPKAEAEPEVKAEAETGEEN